MSKALAQPAMPMGAKFDPEDSLLNNATAAWEFAQHNVRTQREHNAKRLMRKVFRTDEFLFDYTAEIGLDVPTFEVEGELIVWTGEEFSLIEWCLQCGKAPKGRKFASLAGLGRVIAERDEMDAHVCQSCRMLIGSKKR